jgi:hypothetical protein
MNSSFWRENLCLLELLAAMSPSSACNGTIMDDATPANCKRCMLLSPKDTMSRIYARHAPLQQL